MATFTAGPAQTGVQPKSLRVGLVNVKSSLSLDGTSSSIGHTFLMCKIPAHSKIAEMEFMVNILGDYTMQAGDSIDGQRFRSIASYSAGVGDITASVRGRAYSYSADDTLIIRLSLVSASSLGGGVHANVVFSMDS